MPFPDVSSVGVLSATEDTMARKHRRPRANGINKPPRQRLSGFEQLGPAYGHRCHEGLKQFLEAHYYLPDGVADAAANTAMKLRWKYTRFAHAPDAIVAAEAVPVAIRHHPSLLNCDSMYDHIARARGDDRLPDPIYKELSRHVRAMSRIIELALAKHQAAR